MIQVPESWVFCWHTFCHLQECGSYSGCWCGWCPAEAEAAVSWGLENLPQKCMWKRKPVLRLKTWQEKKRQKILCMNWLTFWKIRINIARSVRNCQREHCSWDLLEPVKPCLRRHLPEKQEFRSFPCQVPILWKCLLVSVLRVSVTFSNRHSRWRHVLFLSMRSMPSEKAVIPSMAAAMMSASRHWTSSFPRWTDLILPRESSFLVRQTGRKFWIRHCFVRDVLTDGLSWKNRIWKEELMYWKYILTMCWWMIR